MGMVGGFTSNCISEIRKGMRWNPYMRENPEKKGKEEKLREGCISREIYMYIV
jgi:hypothetical protein